MEIQRKLIKFLSWRRLRVFDESGDCPNELQNLSISLGILIEDWWEAAAAENSPPRTGFRGVFALGEPRLRFAATESDCDSLMLLNVGLILSWVYDDYELSDFLDFARSYHALKWFQMLHKPLSMFPMSSGRSKKEPLILNTSPLDLFDRTDWPAFSRISFAFNKSKVFFLLSPFSRFRRSNSHCSQPNEIFLPRSSITIDKRILEPFYELFSCFVFKK